MRFLALLSLLCYSFSWPETATSSPNQDLMHCLSTQYSTLQTSMSLSKTIHTPRSSSYASILQSSEQNPKWLNSSTIKKPLLIITPTQESEIRAAIVCTRQLGLQIRILSGGHDYEGQSYLCSTPFVLLDMVNLRSVEVNLEDESAWVQSGATLGELYYHIAKKSQVHGFPAGLCPTVGIGGHLSGGGSGTLMRKYGLAADNVVDVYLVDVNGRLLDRKAMGEDLFWAIRGGGGASFGVILSWKIKLVRVPPLVTGFTVSKTLDEGAEQLVHRWQDIAHNQYMEPYVSKNPRAAYLNYRDRDLGTNKQPNTSYTEASVWGIKYFKANFKRLAQVKTKVDPHNFFRNEQSIPLLALSISIPLLDV